MNVHDTATLAAGEDVSGKPPTTVEMECAIYETTRAANLVSQLEDHLLDPADDDTLMAMGIKPFGPFKLIVLNESERDAISYALGSLFIAARAQAECWEAWREAERASRKEATA